MTMRSNMNNVQQNMVTVKCMNVSGKLFSDQTGQFPYKSSRGNQYIMVAYNRDSNIILVEPMKSRAEHELLRAMTKIHEHLKNRGLYLQLQILGNKYPALIKQYFRTEKITYQLVPPNLHHNNATEKAIGSFKDHLTAIICSCDPQFPMHLWCHLIPNAMTTLNLLRQSCINSHLSAEAQLSGRSITTQHHWRHQAKDWWYMKHRTIEEYGHNID